MGGRILTLDTVLSASEHYLARWSTGVESNKAGRLLRYLVCRLWEQGRGKLIGPHLELAQTTIARKLHLSRQWTCILTHRLAMAGWIEVHSRKLPDGTNSSSVWQAGRLLKRLIVMLSKSRRQESHTKPHAKCWWHFSPLKTRSENFLILDRPLQPETLAKVPLLRQWLQRGSVNEFIERGH